MKLDIDRLAEVSMLSFEGGNLTDKQAVNDEMLALIDSLRIPEIEYEQAQLKIEDTMTLREDIVIDSGIKREEFLKNAPEVQAGCFVVPKIV